MNISGLIPFLLTMSLTISLLVYISASSEKETIEGGNHPTVGEGSNPRKQRTILRMEPENFFMAPGLSWLQLKA
uniref:Uncharacterized protein n=1 Tax=Globodera rostochiensis TaxID=31243 RepID=A0A914HTN4_GLORO